MEKTIKVSEHTYVVSCENPGGVTVYRWQGRRKKFDVGVSIDGGEPKVFPFYDSIANWPKEINDKTLKLALLCFASDALSYELSADFEDFFREYGYTQTAEAEKAYKACKLSWDFFHKYDVGLFELTEQLDA